MKWDTMARNIPWSISSRQCSRSQYHTAAGIVFCHLTDGFDGGLLLNVFAVLLVVVLFADIIKTTWASFGDRPANVPVQMRARINDSTLHVSNVCRCDITRKLAQNGTRLSLQRQKLKLYTLFRPPRISLLWYTKRLSLILAHIV